MPYRFNQWRNNNSSGATDMPSVLSPSVAGHVYTGHP